MMDFRVGASAATFALSLVITAAPAKAAVFADFTPDVASADYRWIQSGAQTGGKFFTINSASDTTAQGVATHFTFLDPSLSLLVFLPATFTLDATVADGNPAQSLFSLVSQPAVGGAFSFIYSGPSTVIGGKSLVSGVTNLLSGVFTDARITGAGHSGSANLSLATGGTLTFTSDLGSFGPKEREYSFNLLDAQPAFSAGASKSLSNFIANGGGNFSAAAVPEPLAWSLMVMGFGGLGLMLRTRRRRAPA